MSRLSLVAVLCIVPLTTGCLAVAGLTVGAGVVGYVYYDKNEARQDFEASFDNTWKATLNALRDLKYAVPADAQHSADSGDVVIDDLKVHVARHPDNKTRVSIRIGTFHTAEHRRRSGLILEKIDEKL